MLFCARPLHSIVVSCLVLVTASASVKVEETVVATVQPGAAYVISPAGQRLATVTMRGSRHVILVVSRAPCSTKSCRSTASPSMTGVPA
jgi:hypothetical protein